MSRNPWRPARRGGTALVLALGLCLSGCAMDGPKEDPYESFNRKVFAFNKAVDRDIAQPVARTYKAILPDFARGAVTNFFSNLNDFTVGINELLQGKVEDALETGGRIIFNTTFGLGGLIDFSSGVGYEKRNEDFGQTLGFYGFEPGPYIMLPLLGPSSVRDTWGLGIDAAFTNPIFDPVFGRGNFATGAAITAGLLVLRFINIRSNLLGAEKVLEAAALDEYVFLRNAYLQRRRYLVFDGNPPLEEDFEDPGLDEDLSPSPADDEQVTPPGDAGSPNLPAEAVSQ